MSNTNQRETQLVVIGAGPGGYAAAFAGADKGLKVTLVDPGEQLGGVCLNRGCIPSKALLHIARVIAETRETAEMGLRFGDPQIDVNAIRKWKDSVVGRNGAGVKQLAKARNVEVIQAWARFKDSQTLLLSTKPGGDPDEGELRYEHAILAVGSRPAVIPTLNIKSPRVLDSTSALELPDVPTRLLVIGGGYIGLELGTVYAALGSEVSVVEATDGLLPGADRDLVRVLHNRLKETFRNIYLSAKVVELKDTGSAVFVNFDKAKPENGSAAPPDQEFDRVLISVGRTPNSQGLGLENTKAKIGPRGFVEIDKSCRTADPHIYAIGDIAGEPMLAHKASHEGKVAVDSIVGEPAEFDARAIPAVVFTDPEIAWAGLTETQAQRENIPIEVTKFPWGASGRATAMGRNDGLTKIIVSPETKRMLGVGIVGINAGEMISEAVLAIEMGATAEDLGRSIHPHPTLSETVMEGAELAFGTTTHIYRPPRG
jgi:dihydrolipoamide dehydrogenase